VSALVRPLAAAALAGLIGLGAVLILYTLRPAVAFEMGSPLPSFVQGIHGPERDGALTFAWTSDRVEIDLDGLNRRGAWFCAMRYRGDARGPGLPAPTVDVTVDGARVARGDSTPDYQELAFRIPATDRAGARIGMTIAPTFVPGGADTRTLGVQVDRLGCRPEGLALPPRSALAAVGGAAAFAGGVLAIAGVSIWGVLLVALAMGLGGAALLTIDGGAYGAYPHVILRTALWTGVVVAGAITALDRIARERLSSAARAVCVMSGVAFWLKLIALLHPAKPDIDVVFNVHRLDAVLAGQYHFTQKFIGGVEMPYAIGLYLFAGLWTWITSDHMALIRGVTVATDVVAGALLYPIVLRAWGQRKTALLAVLAYQLPPLAYVVLGNANLPNIFGQSMALVVMATAVTWSLAPRRVGSLLAFAGVLAWALASHVSTAATLTATLGALAVLYFWRGDLARRRSSVAIVIAMFVAAALAWFAFYQDFTNEFASAFGRMFGGQPVTEAAPGMAKGYMGTTERVGDLVRQAAYSAGWPLLILAVFGTIDLARAGVRDRLTSALTAWALVWMVFSASTVFARVGDEYVRYAAEFLGRINLATLPLIAILAARGANRKWLGIAMFGWAIVLAVQSWLAWFAA
jgi:hypothetical protein